MVNSAWGIFAIYYMVYYIKTLYFFSKRSVL